MYWLHASFDKAGSQKSFEYASRKSSQKGSLKMLCSGLQKEKGFSAHRSVCVTQVL